MKYLGKPFIQDHNGIFYLDSKDINIKEFNFHEILPSYCKQRKFYYIENVDDYIIKDTTRLPILFNKHETKKVLKKFKDNQDKFDDIDFPVGYYLDNKKIMGTIVPYYKDAISVRKMISLFSLGELKNYYLHEDNEKRNLVCLCLEILDLIEKMFQEDIIYTDINAGNFLVYNNTIKVVDFEPDYVHFTKNKNWYYKRILSNYNLLINYIWHNYKFNNVFYRPGESFDDAKDLVKSLYKEKR